MRKALLAGVGVLALLLLALVAATWRLSQPKFDESLHGDPLDTLAIAPPDVALTLARVDSGNGPRVVLVTRAAADGLTAVDLEAALAGREDAVEAFVVIGLAPLRLRRAMPRPSGCPLQI